MTAWWPWWPSGLHEKKWTEKKTDNNHYSSTSSTRAVRSRFTEVELGTDAGSAEVVVAEGVASWDVLAGAAILDFLPFFFLL